MYKTLRIACRHSKFEVLGFPLKLTAKTGNFKEKAASKKEDATKSVKTLQINIFLIKALKRRNQPAKGSNNMKKFEFNTFSAKILKRNMYKPCV